jgi:hypothetical protein
MQRELAQENARLMAEIRTWQEKHQAQEERYGRLKDGMRTLLGRWDDEIAEFSAAGTDVTFALGQRTSALRFKKALEDQLSEIDNIERTMSPTALFSWETTGDDRYLASCSCGWFAPVSFTAPESARQAWETHYKVRHAG